MSAGVTITVTTTGFHPQLQAQIDDAVIEEWISNRLNDARNVFIRAAGRGGGGGRVYKRGRGVHRASAPGEYPATDSGRLVGSTEWEMTGPREGQLGSDVEYARYLMFGTSKMAPRKMYDDALEEVMAARPQTDVLAQAARFTVVSP